MKLPAKILKTARIGYLYAVDGACKLVLVHESAYKHPGGRDIEVKWVTIHDTDIEPRFEGRIVLHRRGMIRLCLTARKIKARAPSFDGGSDNTKSKGIATGYVSMQLGDDEYYDSVNFNVFDSLVSCDLTVQPEYVWEAPTTDRWADYPIQPN